jgi:hypothetical protein
MPRGCKPGQKHSGHFSKGFDPRRNTKGNYLYRERASVEQKFREHTETALRALLAVLEDKDAPHKDVVTAANSLLDRAHGKAVDRIQVASLGNDVGNTASLTRDELMARLTQQYTEPSNDLDGGAVDDHGVSYDLEDADEDADYAVKVGTTDDDDIEEADYEELGEAKYG